MPSKQYLFLVLLVFFALPSDAFLSPQAPSSPTTVLFAKKNKAAKKIQVKMLKSVPGTGQKGAVVQVTPAFFNNKLRSTKSAEIISDEEVEIEQSEKAAALAEELKEANEVKATLEETPIRIVKKAGPEGHLFGGIGPKVIMEEVQQVLGKEHEAFLKRKSVKVISVTDGDGKKMRGDIKDTGAFGAKIALTKDVSGNIEITVEAES